MPTQITVDNLTGQPNFDIWLCNTSLSTCVYIDTVTSSPYSFDVLPIFSGDTSLSVKVIDDLNCELIINVTIP
jgi:hypothetical protein